MNPCCKSIIVCVLLSILFTGCTPDTESPSVAVPSASLQPSPEPSPQTACVAWSENGTPLLDLGSGQIYPFADGISSPGMVTGDAGPLCCVAKDTSFHYILPDYSQDQCTVTHCYIDEGGSRWETSVLSLEDPLLLDGGNTYILSFWSRAEGALLVTNSGGYTVFYKTWDSGATWSTSTSVGWHAPHVVGGGFLSADFGVLCYQYHGESPLDLLVTEDGGESWSSLSLQVPGMLTGDYAEGGTPFWSGSEMVLPVTLYRNTEKGLSAVQIQFASADGGSTWTPDFTDLSQAAWRLMQ